MSDNTNGMNTAIVSRIRASLSEVKYAAIAALDSTESQIGRRPTDLAKVLRIDMKLAWKLGHLVRATTPGQILHAVPGAAVVRKLVLGITQAGADPEKLARLQDSFDQRATLITELARDRASFETLVTSMGEADSLQLSVDMRRRYYTALSSMIGVQCASQYRLVVLGPGPDAARYSLVAVHGWSDLRQLTLHGGISIHWPIELSTCRCCGISCVEDLDEATTGSLPLLGEFSRMESIELVETPSASGASSYFRRVDGNLGTGSSADVVLGQIVRDLAPVESGDGVQFQDCVELRVPCKDLVLDLVVSPELTPALTVPRMRMHSLWSTFGQREPEDREQLPIEFKTTKLQPSEASKDPPKGWTRSQHQALGSLVESRTGWRLEAFDHFRTSLVFPFTPSRLQSVLDLTPKAR